MYLNKWNIFQGKTELFALEFSHYKNYSSSFYAYFKQP